MRDLLRRFIGWLASRKKEREEDAKDTCPERTKKEEDEKKRVRALDALLRSKIPGFKRYEVMNRKILVTVEPEAGYGEYQSYLIFKDDRTKRVRVPSDSDCDALTGVAVACKWSDIIFPVPGDARVFYAGADIIQVFKRGDTFESLMIESCLQGGSCGGQ